jgi:uncharacterized membrane protein
MPDTLTITVLFGFLFIVLGIYIPPICGNATSLAIVMMFLTPRMRQDARERMAQKLAGDENWKKFCKRAGRTFLGAGILVVLAALATGEWAFDVMLFILLVAIVYIGIVSLWYVMQNTK